MKVLICADAHADNYAKFSRINEFGINTRLQDHLDVLESLGPIAERHNIDLLAFLGDLFNSRVAVPIDVEFRIHKVMKKLSKMMDILLLVGNHDQFLRDGSVHSVYPFSSFCTVIDNAQLLELGGVQFVLLPFEESNEGSLKLLAEIELSVKDRSDCARGYLLGHLGLTGAVVGPKEHRMKTELDAKDLRPDLFRWCLLGHYHKFQMLGKNIVYVGSMLPKDFGEEGESKYAFVIDTDDKEDVLKKIKLNVPKFVSCSIDTIDERVTGNYVKVTCKGAQRALAVEKLEQSSAKEYVIEEEFEDSFQPRIQLDPLQSPEEMVKAYVQHSETDLDKKRLISVAETITKQV